MYAYPEQNAVHMATVILSDAVAMALSARAPRLLSVLQDVWTKPEGGSGLGELGETGVGVLETVERLLEVGLETDVDADIGKALEGMLAISTGDVALGVAVLAAVAAREAMEEDMTTDVEIALVDPLGRI
jgi:hypothetical protein